MHGRRWLAATSVLAGIAGLGCASILGIEQFPPDDLDSGKPTDGSAPLADGPAVIVPDGTIGADGAPEGGQGGEDAGVDGQPGLVPARLVVAHTAPGVPPFRLCWATGSAGALSVLHVPALPDGVGAGPAYPGTGPYAAVSRETPGAFPGTITAFPTIADVTANDVTPFVVLSASIANEVSADGGSGTNGDGGAEDDCVALIGLHGFGTGETGLSKGKLVLGADYFPLAPIPAGSLRSSRAYLLTLNGCLAHGTAGASYGQAQTIPCGPTYDGGNSTSLGIAELDTTTPVPADGIGVQFAHRSQPIELTSIGACSGLVCVTVHDPASDGVWPTVVPFIAGEPGDAGSRVDATAATPYSGSGISPLQPFTLTSTSASEIASDLGFGVFLQPLDGGAPNNAAWPGTHNAPGDLFSLSFATIAALSAWSVWIPGTATGFQAGQSYTFILAGDPAEGEPLTIANPDGGSAPAPNPSWNGRGPHILAFPNVFTTPKR